MHREPASITGKVGCRVQDMSVVALRADRVLLAEGFVPAMNVLVENGRVTDVCADARRPDDIEVRRIRGDNLLIANHNAWILLSAFERANELAFETDREDVPPSWAECLDRIDEAFTVETWDWWLEERRGLLNAVAPAAI